ncbi:MAG: hypothetical protein R3314_07685 [Longimicrobiales bacterium]|nr:hypothetical protein [Longimicrobiales bacterium]
MPSFTAEERRVLAAALAGGAPLECPACGGDLSRREVSRPREVSYVRHRVWLLCPECHRSGAIDLPPDPTGPSF